MLPSRSRRVSPGPSLRTAMQTSPASTRVLGELYLPVWIVPLKGAVDLTLDALQLDTMTAGRLSYGHDIRLETAEAEHYHVNVPLSGHAVSRPGPSTQITTSSRQAAVFVPRQAAVIEWAEDCVQLCLMIRPSAIELDVEQLLGRSLLRPLAFERVMDLTTPIGHSWREALDLLLHAMDHGSVDLATHAVSRRHVERLLLEGLILGHHHNYTDALLQWQRPSPRGSWRRQCRFWKNGSRTLVRLRVGACGWRQRPLAAGRVQAGQGGATDDVPAERAPAPRPQTAARGVVEGNLRVGGRARQRLHAPRALRAGV